MQAVHTSYDLAIAALSVMHHVPVGHYERPPKTLGIAAGGVGQGLNPKAAPRTIKAFVCQG
jgi:hypothetical protein